MKILASHADDTAAGSSPRSGPGSRSPEGLSEAVFDDVGDSAICVLDEGAADIRDLPDAGFDDVTFFLGDHLGFEDAHRAWLASRDARGISVGPRSLHAEDAITVVLNEARPPGRSTQPDSAAFLNGTSECRPDEGPGFARGPRCAWLRVMKPLTLALLSLVLTGIVAPVVAGCAGDQSPQPPTTTTKQAVGTEDGGGGEDAPTTGGKTGGW